MSKIRNVTAVERRYGPKFRVEVQDQGGRWVPYQRDCKDRDEASAQALLARLAQQQPGVAVRVVQYQP